jgi:hypothetical protein
LEPEANYTVADLDANKPEEVSGRKLMEEGLLVTIPGKPGAAVITYKKSQE